MKTFRPTPGLAREHFNHRFREGTQRFQVVSALLKSDTHTKESLTKTLDGPAYWATLKHKDSNGKPDGKSWIMQDGGGIPASVEYHLRALQKAGLIEVLNH